MPDSAVEGAKTARLVQNHGNQACETGESHVAFPVCTRRHGAVLSVREGPGRPQDGKRQDGGRGSSGGMKTPVGKFARKLANRACSPMALERAFAVTFAPPTIS